MKFSEKNKLIVVATFELQLHIIKNRL